MRRIWEITDNGLNFSESKQATGSLSQGQFVSISGSENRENMSTLEISSLTNHSGCKLPWVDYVEENDTNVDLVILVCLLLTLLFDTFLIAIILAHEDLRKQVNDLKLPSSSDIRLSVSEVDIRLLLVLYITIIIIISHN